MLQIIKRAALVLGSTIILGVICLYFILRYYEDDVVAYAFDKSKDIFTRPVTINDIDLAFWHTFPNASLHLSDVNIPDVFDPKDTLLHANDIYLEFNLLDLFQAHYELLELEMDEATAKIKFDKMGQDNYHFWKAKADTSGFSVALEEVLLKEVRFYYRDEQAKKVVDVFTTKTKAEGDLTQDEFELTFQTKSVLRQLWSNDQTLTQEQSITADAKIMANFTEKNYVFQNASIGLGDINALVEGVINTKKDPYFDLSVRGNEIELQQLFSLLPNEMRHSIDRYDPEGEVQLSATYKGSLGPKSSPQLRVDMIVHNGSLQSPDGEVRLNQIGLHTNIKSMSDGWQVGITQCDAGLAGGQVHLLGQLHIGKKTEVDIALQANASATDLQHFFSLDTLEICNGNMEMELKSKGELRMAPGDSLLDFTALHNTGRAKWSNGEMKLKKSNRHFTGIQADIELDNANAYVKQFYGNVNGCDFAINGSFKNLVPFLIDDRQRLLIEASLQSERMDFNQLLETSQSNETYQLNLPKRIDFSLQSKISKFVFRQFYADQVQCVAHLYDGHFFIDPLRFNTAGGLLHAQLSLDQKAPDLYFVNCLVNLENMDITEVFREFENFDQSFIQDRHLKGKANAMVQFQAPLTTALEVQYRDLYSVIDLKIQDGQLIGLESLQEIAEYIRSNKWIAPFVDEDQFAEKLKDIRFSTLENTIEIKNEIIHIPMMDIRSSAMDISVSGQHQFNDQINYSLGFNVRDMLIRKQKEWQEQDDGLGHQIFIYMRGTTDNPEFGLDKEVARKDRQEELQAEKQNMKALLKEELGLFKKDNKVGAFKETPESKETSTSIEWEGFDPPKETPKESPKKAKETKKTESKPAETKPKKTRRWLKERE